MPNREHLPVFWSNEELEALEGTELKDKVLQDRSERPTFSLIYRLLRRQYMEDDFNAYVQSLMERYPDRFESCPIQFSDFQDAASLVSSRAFFVDDFHGLFTVQSVFEGRLGQSLVPLADVFNHKCSIVVLDRDHELEGVDSEDEEKDRLEMTDVPKEYRLEISICSATSKQGVKGLEIRAMQNIPKGNEIHNTYGELDNEELLHKYGFCIEDNPFDSVEIDKQRLSDAICSKKPQSLHPNRIRFLLELLFAS